MTRGADGASLHRHPSGFYWHTFGPMTERGRVFNAAIYGHDRQKLAECRHEHEDSRKARTCAIEAIVVATALVPA